MWRMGQRWIETLVQLPLLVLMQLVPALFHVLVWLTYVLFLTGTRLAGRPLDVGPVILLSGVVWGGLALLGTPWLALLMPVSGALLVLGISGAVWGLCIGGQVAWRWQIDRLRMPDLDPYRQYGLPPHLFGTGRRRRQRNMEKMMREGIILGETEDPFA
jgi:hypothetical protein